MPGDGRPTPTLLSSGTARSIRDALIDAERAEFERQFAEEMAAAAQTLDLTGVLRVLSTYRKIAEITQRQGVAAHRRMLDQAERLQRGEDVPTVPGHIHKLRSMRGSASDLCTPTTPFLMRWRKSMSCLWRRWRRMRS
jgi:hypothetical protein